MMTMLYSECTDDVNGVDARDQLRRTSRLGEVPVSNEGSEKQVKRKWIRRGASLSQKFLQDKAEDESEDLTGKRIGVL